MARIGNWKSDAARTAYVTAYRSLAHLQPIPFTELDVHTSFGSTHIHRFGSGDATPLVLLHPLGGNGLCWFPVIEDLARDRVVYALDTIGAPGSSEQTAPITAGADYGRWIDDVLARLHLDRAHVLGYSDGAWRAMMAGTHSSERVASLTLVEPGVGLVKMRWSVLLKMLRFGARPTEANMRKAAEWVTPGIRISDQEIACSSAALGYRTRTPWPTPLTDEELQGITAPTLVIFGADTIVSDPEAAAARVRGLIRHGETTIFPGIGHGLLYQSPHREKVLARVREFLRQHDSADVR
ncbi:alpha/beta fold hydrolase [Nocardia jejuensis]|uniref:alpha/beta fold hydrolase n=1 Tax=Nocardia jejuensis TaxID=328049 RepID=UPI00082F01DC|nr:alpha/beta hydrolase [Nocardia jejuensis]